MSAPASPGVELVAAIRVAITAADVTGADLVTALRFAARTTGVGLYAYIRPIAAKPKVWLDQVERAKRPMPHTVARVRALIAGRPIPPLPDGRDRSKAMTAPAIVVRPDPVPPTLARDRDPCRWCGTRADLGCAHQPPSLAWDPFADRRAA